MRVIHLNETDITGGAGRAAYRIHTALRENGIQSRMWVLDSRSGDATVLGSGKSGKVEGLTQAVRHSLSRRLVGLLKTENRNAHTPALWNSDWPEQLNESDADVVNLHWISGRMLSIQDIARIRKPLVWTLHDMWAFCGAEHYTDDLRWRDGYERANRPAYESGYDVNRWTWKRKRKNWETPIHIITPSTWLADCAKTSVLMRDWPVQAVPNCLDTERWKPLEMRLARELLGLPVDVPLVLFGALGGGGDPRKGFDLLLAALGHLRRKVENLHLVVFGQRAPVHPPDFGFPLHYTGHLHDDLSLQAVYSAADAFVIPSRQDNLPNTGVEAHACGTPIVAFRTGGLSDIVEHRQTGYLAEAFDTQDLAAGIQWTLTNCDSANLRSNARRRAVESFSAPNVTQRYLDVYRKAIGSRLSKTLNHNATDNRC